MMLYFLTEGIAIKPENYLIVNPGGEGEGGTQPIFTLGGSAPRSNPLPFYTPFFTKKVPPSVYLLLTDCTSFT